MNDAARAASAATAVSKLSRDRVADEPEALRGFGAAAAGVFECGAEQCAIEAFQRLRVQPAGTGCQLLPRPGRERVVPVTAGRAARGGEHAVQIGSADRLARR